MARLELTGKIDALAREVAALLEQKGLPPATRAALKEIQDLLAEAADEAENAGL